MAVSAAQIPTGTKYRALFCAMAVNLLIGSYYMYSNMYMYVGHYLRRYNPDLDSEGKKVRVIMPIWLIIQSCCSVLSVRVADKIGFRSLNFLAFTWFTINNGLMIYVKDYYTYIGVYGVMNGMAIGFGYLPALYTAWTYFPDKKSVATGVILFCAGMSSSISSPLVTMIVNPDNLEASNEKVIDRVPTLFMYLTIIYGTITVIAGICQPPPFESAAKKEKKEIKRRATLSNNLAEKNELMGRLRGMSRVAAINNRITMREMDLVNKEMLTREFAHTFTAEHALIIGQLEVDAIEDIRQEDLLNPEIDHDSSIGDHSDPRLNLVSREDERAEELYRMSREIQENSCPSISYALRSRTFYQLAIMAFSLAIYNYFMLTVWKDLYKAVFNLTDKELSRLLIVGAAANSSFRIIIGVAMLKVGFKTLYYIAVFMAALNALTFTPVVEETKITSVGIAYLFFAFAGLGTMVTIFPTISVKAFGSNVGSRIYPMMYLCFSTASLSAYLVYTYVEDKRIMFYIFGGIAVVGLITNVFFNPEPSWTWAMVKEAEADYENIEKARLAK